tara:strand:+ start:280 stop:981 length:702 start_codon:yes stop_codon:yes gene_type:complete
MDTNLKNYKYVSQYSENNINICEDIEKALRSAWQYTPSKNNFMPYKVHVLGPKHKQEKELVYWKCLANETKVNKNPITTMEGLKQYEADMYPIWPPNYRNIRSAPYLLMFTQRVEDKLNSMQEHLVEQKKFVYEQMATHGPNKEIAQTLAYLEIGMFASTFANVCLGKGIDVSFIKCFSTNLNAWTEPEFSFLDSGPLLLMTAGIGTQYRRDPMPKDKDLKPDFNRIVNIVSK